MGKGGGGGGGRKNSGGAGGRSAGGGGLSPGAKRALVFLGALGVGLAADPSARRGAALLATAVGDAAARQLTPVTAAMRDKVRSWAIERASNARGDIQTEGVALAAARAALNGTQAIGPIPTSARGWRDIPDNSVFSTRTGSYTGRDIKSLVREAVTAGKNHVANAPQLEAFTGPRYADKARAAAAGARVAKKSPSKRALKAARERVGRPKK